MAMTTPGEPTKNYRIAIDSYPVYFVSDEVSPDVFGIELTAAELADWKATAEAFGRWQVRLGAC